MVLVGQFVRAWTAVRQIESALVSVAEHWRLILVLSMVRNGTGIVSINLEHHKS